MNKRVSKISNNIICTKQEARLRRDLIFSVALSFPLLLAMIFSVAGVDNGFAAALRRETVQLVLSGILQVFFGARFYRGMWRSLRTGRANADTLVALGTSAAFLLSVTNMLRQMNDLYFGTSAVLIVTALLGRYLAVRARMGEPPARQAADRVAGVFVPVAAAIAALTFTGWLIASESSNIAIVNAAAVLVIACPCALGLAAPAAVMAGMSRSVRFGARFSSGEQLENACNIDTIVLDKTGALTTGIPNVTNVISQPGYTCRQVLGWAAATVERLEHPLAGAIVAFAQKENGSIGSADKLLYASGRGVRAVVDGLPVLVGTRSVLAEESIEPGESEKILDMLEQSGKTGMYVAADGMVVGLIAVVDVLKADAAATVAELKAMGLAVTMLTGDNARTAATVAGSIGINNVVADVPAWDKAAEIARLRSGGGIVAVAADGVADAAALESADVGFAIGPDGELSSITAAIRLSHATKRKIRQNVFWAFAFHAIGIPFAALGLLTPFLVGVVMALGIVAVVINALGLKRFK